MVNILKLMRIKTIQDTSEDMCMDCHHLVTPSVAHQFVRMHPLPSLPRWFSIVMYLVFLFTVIVVLLNLLIAQMSDTYNKIQEDVEGTFAIARARIIARLQKGKRLFCRGKVRKW